MSNLESNPEIHILKVHLVPDTSRVLFHFEELMRRWQTWKNLTDAEARDHPDVKARRPWIGLFSTILECTKDPEEVGEDCRESAYRIAALELVESELCKHGLEARTLRWWIGNSGHLDEILRKGQCLCKYPAAFLSRYPQSAYELAAFDAAVNAMRLNTLGQKPEQLTVDHGWSDADVERHGNLLLGVRKTIARAFRAQNLCVEPAGGGQHWIQRAQMGLRPEDVLVAAEPWEEFACDTNEAPFVGSDEMWPIYEAATDKPYPDLLLGYHSDMLQVDILNAADPFDVQQVISFKPELREPDKRNQALRVIVKVTAPHPADDGGGRKRKPRLKRPQMPARDDRPRLNL